MLQGIKEQIGVLTPVESKGHFIQVGRKMLGADFVPRPDNAPFEQRERGLDGVGVDIAINVDPIFMLDGFVFRSVNSRSDHCLWVASPFVSDEHLDTGRIDIFLDVFRQRSRGHVLGFEKAQFTSTLSNADHWSLAVVLLGSSWCAASNERFIHLYDAAKRLPMDFLHRVADAMTEVPRCLISYTQ